MVSITVAIVTYRRPERLSQTLASLRAIVLLPQMSVRLLVVDNDKASSAWKIVEAMRASMPFPVEYVVEPIPGIPQARNRALAEAIDSDYIAFIDDDDIADPHWLVELYRAAQAFNAQVVKGQVIYRFPPGEKRLTALDIFSPVLLPSGSELDNAWTNNVIFSTWIFRHTGLRFDQSFTHTGGSDSHFFSMAKEAGAKIVLSNEAIVYSDIAGERTGWKWLARRHMRIGATMTMSDMKRSGLLYAIRQVLHSLADSAAYALRMAKRAITGNHPFLHPQMIACFMLGRITGLLHLSPHEYKPTATTPHIAYVLGRFPVMTETFIGQEIRALEENGYRTTLVALHPPEVDYQPEDASLAARTLYFPDIAPEESVKLLRRYCFRFPRILNFVLRQTSEPRRSLLVHAAHLADHFKKHGCTHVHAHFGWGAASYAIAAAKLAGLSVSFTCHGSDVYARPQDLTLKCRAADAVVSVAPTISSDLRKRSGGTPCHTITCGVDIERFKPLAGESNRHDRWLFVGRLKDCKGLDDILTAWSIIPSAQRPKLDIVGDGELRDELEHFVTHHALAPHITFLGNRDSSWIAQHGPAYRAFISAFKQGSDGSRDTFPMALKEAMAMALPLVTTSFIDIPALVGKECALLCPPSNPGELATAVLWLMQLPQAAVRRMGNAGRYRVQQHFSLMQQVAQMNSLFGR